MNYLKRVIRSVVYSKKNTILILAIFALLATLILSGISIYSAAMQGAERLKDEVKGKITVRKEQTIEYAFRFYRDFTLTNDDAEEIKSLDFVEKHDVLGYSNSRGLTGIETFKSEIQQEEFGKNNMMQVFGSYESANLAQFINGEVELLSGRHISYGEQGVIIVSADTARLSNLDVGDTVNLDTQKPNEGGGNIELEIVGIYSLLKESSYTQSPMYNLENMAFVSPDAVFTLNGDNQIYSFTLSVDSIGRIREYAEQINTVLGEKAETLKIVVDDREYRSLSSSVTLMTTVSQLMMFAAFAIGVVSLSLLVMIMLKERDFEIGVLLSMGESKMKITIQLVAEILIPVIAGIGIAILIAGLATEGLIEIISRASSIAPMITGSDVGLLAVSSIIIVILSSISTIIKVSKYHPRDMLTQMG